MLSSYARSSFGRAGSGGGSVAPGFATRVVPVDYERFDTWNDQLFLLRDASELSTATNCSTDSTIQYDGGDTVKLTSVNAATADARYTLPDPVDASGASFFEFDAHVTGADDIASFGLELWSGNINDKFAGSIAADYKVAGVGDGWRHLRFPLGKLTAQGNADWANITLVRLYVRGAASTTVTINLGEARIGKVPGGVMMYLDDGSAGQYLRGFTIMESYGLKGTLAIVTNYPGQSGQITWEQAREMQAAGWAIASHTKSHANLSTLSEGDLRTELADSQQALRDNGLALGSYGLVAPYGGWNALVAAVAPEYFRWFRTEGTGSGLFRGFPPSSPMYQRYFSPQVGVHTVADVKGWVDDAAANGYDLAIAWHGIEDVSTDPYEWLTADFDEVCSYVAEKRDAGEIVVPTMYDVHPASVRPEPLDDDGTMFLVRRAAQTGVLILD